MRKRINKILWHGDELLEEKAKAPGIATSADGLDGLNEGEIYISNNEKDPALFIRTSSGKVVRVGVNYEELKKLFLSRTDDDTAEGLINFEKGVRIKNLILKVENDVLSLTNIENGKRAHFAASGTVSSLGVGTTGGGGGSSEGGASALYQLLDVLSDGTKVEGAEDGSVLTYDENAGKWKATKMDIPEADLTEIEGQLASIDQLIKALQGKDTEHSNAITALQQKDGEIEAAIGSNTKGIESLQGQLDTLVSGDASDAIDTFNEVVAFLKDIEDTDTLEGILAGKQNKITETNKLDYSLLANTPLLADFMGSSAIGGTASSDNFSAVYWDGKQWQTRTIYKWALASAKPSYTTSEVTEGTRLYFTDDRAKDALKSTTDALSDRIAKFEKMFQWGNGEDSYVKTPFSFASDKTVSSLGVGSSEGGGVSYNRLDSWDSYTSDKAGYVLSAALGWDLKTRLDNLDLGDFDLSGYLTKSEAQNTYATISALNGKQNAITANNKLSASLVSGLATVATSGKYGDLSGLPTFGSLAFKDSLTASDIPSLSWSKITSDKPTTLDGYGITDALPLIGGELSGDLTVVEWLAVRDVIYAHKGLDVSSIIRGLADNDDETWSITDQGAATFGSTLKVTGETTLGDKLTISKNGMSVTGAASFENALSVSGESTFKGKTTHNGGIGATSGTFSTTLGVTGATSLKSTLSVTGATTLSSTLGVTGDATFNSKIYIGGKDAYIYWDADKKVLRTNVSFASEKTVSSLGVGSESGGGGGSADWGAVPTSIIPVVNGEFNLGTAANRWNVLYANGMNITDSVVFSTNSSVIAYGTFKAASIDGNLMPSIDGEYNIGSPTMGWDEIYANGVNASVITEAGLRVATKNWVESNYVLNSAIDDYVTKTGYQTISGKKDFTGGIDIYGQLNGYLSDGEYRSWYIDHEGNGVFTSLKVGSYDVLHKGNTSYSPVLTTGTKIGTITIGGTATDLYAPVSGEVPSLTDYAKLSSINSFTAKQSFTAEIEVSKTDQKAPLTVQGTGNTAFVKFTSGGSNLGYLGFSAVNTPAWMPNDATEYLPLATKATTLAGYGITDNVFVPRTRITSGENADNLIANGIYLNASGNGSGNSNFPQLYSTFLNFFQSDSYRAQLSVGTSLWFRRKIDSWESWRECLDSTNFSNYALPLSGGTIDSPNSIPLVVNSTSSNSVEIRLQHNSGNKVAFLWDTSNGSYLYSYVCDKFIGILDDGTPYYYKDGFNTLIHSGNISDYALSKAGGEIQGSLGVTGNISAQGNITTSNGSFVGSTISISGVASNQLAPAIIFSSYGEAFDGRGNFYMSGQSGDWNIFDQTIERVLLRIRRDTGNVLIGTTTDSGFKLDVNGTTAAEGFILKPSYIGSRIGGVGLDGATKTIYLFSDLDAGDIYLFANGDGNKNITLKGSTGNVLIGTTTDNGNKLYVAGDIYTTSGMSSQYIELNSKGELQGYGGFIDFHFNGSTDDYTCRIIEDGRNNLFINSSYLRLAGATTIGSQQDLAGSTYKLYVNGNSYVNGVMRLAGDLTVNANQYKQAVSGCLGIAMYAGLSSTEARIDVIGADGNWAANAIELGATGNVTMYHNATVKGWLVSTETIYAYKGLDVSKTIRGIADNDDEVWSIDNTGAASFNSLTMSGPISFSDASANGTASKHYVSAGGGYSANSGKCGIKLVCCDQHDTQTGLGQDLTGLNGGYELTVAGGLNADGGYGYISFATHTVNSKTYRQLGYFKDYYGTISFHVNGNSYVNGSLTVSRDILPSTTDTQSLGSTSSYWKNLYVGIITGHYQSGDVVKFSGSINANEGNISCKSLIVNGVTITGDYATKTDLDSYLPKSGGAVTGTLSIGSTRLNVGSTTLHGDVSLEYGALTITHGTIGSSYWSITNDGAATVRTLSQTSDITKKNVISDIRLSLGTMANAPLIKFTWADGLNSRLHVGTIAQYWDACLPEVVSTTTNGTLALGYGELGVAMGISLATHLTETNDEVSKLKKRVEELENENKRLQERVDALVA